VTIHLAHDFEIVNCGRDDCHQTFAMTAEFYNKTKATGQTWYCPSGHARVWGGPSTKAQLTEAKTRETHLRDQLAAAVRDAETARSLLVRDRERFAAGICPCCRRTFDNVRRHMSTQHPDYAVDQVARTVKLQCTCGARFETYRGLRIHQGKQRTPDWDTAGSRQWHRGHLTKV
jgi:hypothetical protein